jgi:adenylylsulfate kinase-like enzyme
MNEVGEMDPDVLRTVQKKFGTDFYVTVSFAGRTGAGKSCLSRWLERMLQARGIEVLGGFGESEDTLCVKLKHPSELNVMDREAEDATG